MQEVCQWAGHVVPLSLVFRCPFLACLTLVTHSVLRLCVGSFHDIQWWPVGIFRFVYGLGHGPHHRGALGVQCCRVLFSPLCFDAHVSAGHGCCVGFLCGRRGSHEYS